MSMYYGMSLPFDASHMSGMLTSSLYSSSTTPTHLSQQQQQPLALPLSLAPSVGSAVTLQQYQQLVILQQLQQQQQQLEAANARSPAGDESNIAQQREQLHMRQQQLQQQQQQQQHQQQLQQRPPAPRGRPQSHTSGLISQSASSFSPLSSPTNAAASASLSSQLSSAPPSVAAARFDRYTNVNEAMSDNEYVAMLAERWRGGGYEGQSLRQLAVEDLAERKKARRRTSHSASTSATSPSSSALAASALAHSSGSSPLRPVHTPLRANGHGSGAAHLSVPTPSSFLVSHFNFSPLSPNNHASPTASTPASLLSPGRDGLGPLFSPSRFYASPADRHGHTKQTKKRMRDHDVTLQPLNLNTDDDGDEQPQQQPHEPQQRTQQQKEHDTYLRQPPAAHTTTNGRHSYHDNGDNNLTELNQFKGNNNNNKRAAGGNDNNGGNQPTQQRAGKRHNGPAANKRSHSRKSKQQRDEQQRSDTDSKQRERQLHRDSASNGVASASLIPFPLSSLTTPMRSGKADPLFSPTDVSRLSVDTPSLFSPLQTPQRHPAQHNQFFSETPQHSFTHLFSPGPALFASSSSHFPSPAAFVGMTPATPERKNRNRLTAASPIQLLLPSPLSSPAHEQHFDSNKSSSNSNSGSKSEERPSSSSQATGIVSASSVSLVSVSDASRSGSSASPSLSPGLAPLSFPATPTPLNKTRASQGNQSFLVTPNTAQRASGDNDDDSANHHDSNHSAAASQPSAASNEVSPASSSSSSDSSAAASVFSPSHSTLRFEPLHDLHTDPILASPYRMTLSMAMPLPLPMSLSSPFATPSVPTRHRSTALLLSSPSSSLSEHDSLRPPSNSSRAETPIAQSTPSQLLPLLPATPNTPRQHADRQQAGSGEWEEMDKEKEQQRVQHSVPEPMMIA